MSSPNRVKLDSKMKIPIVNAQNDLEVIGWVELSDSEANQMAHLMANGFSFRLGGVVDVGTGTPVIHLLSFLSVPAIPIIKDECEEVDQ